MQAKEVADVLEICERMKDVDQVVNNLVEVVLDPSKRKRDVTEAVKSGKKASNALNAFIPVLKKGAGHMQSSGGAYINARRETMLKREQRRRDSMRQTPLKNMNNLDNYLERHTTTHMKYESLKKRQNMKKGKENKHVFVDSMNEGRTRSKKPQKVIVKPPQNGIEYTPREAGAILSKINKPGHVIDMWVQKKLVPVHRTQCFHVRSLTINKQAHLIR